MRNLLERFRAEFTPIKAIMLIVCIAIFLFVVGFIGYNVYQFYIAGNGNSSAAVNTASYALGALIETGMV